MLAFSHPFDELFMPTPLWHRHLAVAPDSRRQLRENEHDYTLTLALPGMRPDDLKLTIAEDVLAIKGESKTAHRNFSISRALQLPRDVDADKVTASSENGLMIITLPKRARVTHELTVVEGAPSAVAEDDYEFALPLPGICPSDLKLTAEDGVLTIEGETKTAHRNFSISRALRLPEDAEAAAASASAENGMLTIVMPKSARPAPLAIQVGSAPAHTAEEAMDAEEAPAAASA